MESKKIKTNLEIATNLLDGTTDDEYLEMLPVVLRDLNYEEKLDLISDILCNEWHLITHHEFIRKVLDIFAKQFK